EGIQFPQPCECFQAPKPCGLLVQFDRLTAILDEVTKAVVVARRLFKNGCPRFSCWKTQSVQLIPNWRVREQVVIFRFFLCAIPVPVNGPWSQGNGTIHLVGRGAEKLAVIGYPKAFAW